MKISIIGYGQMGHMVQQVINEKNQNPQSMVPKGEMHKEFQQNINKDKLEIHSIIDPYHAGANFTTFCDEAMESVDVCIIFTQPDQALKNIEDACKWNKQIVLGTTGWIDKMDEVKAMIQNSGNALVYASNFSIGVNIFFNIIKQAANIINSFDMYDIFAFEAHHKKKIDSPSGTAITMGQILLDQIERKTKLADHKMDKKIEDNELHFASVRGGSVPGTHEVTFDSEFDSIQLKHTARNRMGFANGAVFASGWIQGKKGLYTEKDMMNEILGTQKG